MAADVVSASSRHNYFTAYEIFFGIGTVISGWTFGGLAGLNTIYPFLFSIILSMVVLLMTWFMVESLPPTKRKAELGLRSSNTAVALSGLVCGLDGTQGDTAAQLRILSSVFALLNLCYHIWLYASMEFLRVQLGFSTAGLGSDLAANFLILLHIVFRGLH